MNKFGELSTSEEVLQGIDLTGKRVLITGVSSGLGAETLRVLLDRGAEIVGVARDLEKARKVISETCSEFPDSRLLLMEMDLSSLSSVRRCADLIMKDGRPLDVIIANAGVMACPRGVTEDGFETQIGTNYLGHFVFINRIAPLLRTGGRVVNVSSLAHRFSDVYVDDLNIQHRPYVEFQAYGASKTAIILYTVELDRRLKPRGVRATSLHPGGIATDLSRHVTAEVAAQVPRAVSESYASGRAVEKTVSQGAATSVWCGFVADPDEIGGRYCEDCQVSPVVDDPDAAHGVRSYALSSERAQQLWKKSEILVGETFDL